MFDELVTMMIVLAMAVSGPLFGYLFDKRWKKRKKI